MAWWSPKDDGGRWCPRRPPVHPRQRRKGLCRTGAVNDGNENDENEIATATVVSAVPHVASVGPKGLGVCKNTTKQWLYT